MVKLSELERLKEFAAIDSTTLNAAGVDHLQTRVAKVLELIGFDIRWMRGEARFARLLVAELRGQHDRFISLVTHSDTVLGNYQPFTIDGAKAYGSGVIDNKGGLVVGLGAVERFVRQTAKPRLGLRFICSPNEEMGSIGFTDHFRTLARDTAFGLGLEPALDDGSIIYQRRGNRWYDIEVTGREAHAGRSYGHDANAAHDLAKKITRFAKLTDYAKDVSVNVGHIDGGKDKHNIVCGFARAKLDVRFPSFKSRDRLHRKIERIIGRVDAQSVDGKYQARASYTIVDDCPPFSLTRDSRKLARVYAGILSPLENREVNAAAAGGAGDVNYLSTTENTVLDGLGPVGGEMHTVHEFLNVPTLATRAEGLSQLLRHLQGI